MAAAQAACGLRWVVLLQLLSCVRASSISNDEGRSAAPRWCSNGLQSQSRDLCCPAECEICGGKGSCSTTTRSCCKARIRRNCTTSDDVSCIIHHHNPQPSEPQAPGAATAEPTSSVVKIDRRPHHQPHDAPESSVRASSISKRGQPPTKHVTVRIEHAQSARALGRLHSSKNVASADEALPQSAGSGSELQDDVPIVFAVLTGKEHHNDRAAAAKQTWCAGINACIFFSDASSATLPTISISFDGLPSLTEYERAQLRYLPVLDYMRELMTSGRDMKFGKTKWSAPTRATGPARILPPGLLASRALSPAEVEGTHLPCTNRVTMLFYWHTGW